MRDQARKLSAYRAAPAFLIVAALGARCGPPAPEGPRGRPGRLILRVRAGVGRRAERPAPRVRVRRRRGQREAERRARARPTRHPEAPAVRLDNAARDREPEPRAAIRYVDPPPVPLEDAIAVLARDPRASVDHREYDFAPPSAVAQ